MESISSTLFKDKRFMKTLLAIAVPISFQTLVQSSLSMIDQMMIGQFGESAIAGVGLGGTISFILMIALGGVVTGGSIFMSQFWGAKNYAQMKKTMATTLRLGVSIAIFISLLAGFFPKTALGIFTNDSKVIELGSGYLQIVALSYTPMFLIMNFSSLLRNTGLVKIPMVTGIISVFINTGLNFILIFGMLGMPKLGITGAAIATVVSRVFEALLLMFICYQKDHDAFPGLKDLLHFDLEFSKLFLITVYPVLLNEFFWVLGDSMYSVIYGHMGTSEMAAMTMTFPIQGLFIGLFTGISGAAGIMLGNELGSGANEQAVQYAKRFVWITCSGAILVSVLIGLLAKWYVLAYHVSPEVSQLSMELLYVFAAVIWVKVTNMVVGNGILRSGGQTKFTFIVDMIGLWGIGVPLGFFAAFYLDLSVTWVYLLIAVEEFVRLALCLWRMNSRKWLQNLNEIA